MKPSKGIPSLFLTFLCLYSLAETVRLPSMLTPLSREKLRSNCWNLGECNLVAEDVKAWTTVSQTGFVTEYDSPDARHYLIRGDSLLFRGYTAGNDIAAVADSAPSVGSVASAAATYHSDQKPYSLTAYEPSQRRQAVSSTKAGEAWHNGGHRTTVRRLVNDQSAYRCPKLTVDSDGGITMSGYYTTGTLSVEETTDEEGLAEAVFTDIRGLCRLRRRGNAETHYIYDGYGLLRYILPPDVTPATMTAGNSVLTESAYVYSYDYRGKVEYAKIPGRGPSRYRYDSAGRLLAETDADLGGKWRIHVYDTAGRDVLQAECAITEEGILNIKEAQNAQPPQKGTGTWGYTTPYSLPSGFSVCRADYYDGYGGFDAAQPMARYGGATLVATPKGRLTGTRLICDDGTDHTLTYRYDRFGRLAQTTDDSGSHTHTTATEYNYSGQPVKVTEKLRHMSGESWNERMFVTEHTYDKAGRLSSTTVKLDGKTVAYTERGYDGIGRPASVAMKKSDGATVWSGQEYLYDVHGWPTRLKTSLWSGGAAVASVSGLASAYYPETSLTGGVTEAATQVESYTETVSYADGSSPRYDGTPSSRTLVNGGRYDYTFDSLCRLTGADYTPPQGNGGEDFSAEYTYDILSRPLTAKRMGVVDTDGTTETFGVLDDMSLEYDGALPSVRRSDTGEVEGRSFYGRTGWTQGISMASSTMDFNSAGRLVKDTGRGLGTVQYNTLGLPTLMSSATTNHSASPRKERVYDAAGRLMGQTEVIKLPYGYGYGLGVTDDRRFIGSFTLNLDKLERVDFPGGYIDGTGNAHFLYRDWQGNVVLTVDADNNVEQMVDYYPYGEPWREPWGQRQTLFAGKERQQGQLSGDWDFGPRHLSSPSMLWSAPDENAADNPWWSPWAYCGGNPVRYVDPNGQDVLITVGDRIITITAELILYGDGATEEIRDIYQKKINEVWGQVTKYRHNANLGGLATEYDVEWDVNVRLKGLEENIVYNGYNNDVEVIMDPAKLKNNTSTVEDSRRAFFRGYGTDGYDLQSDNPAAHEFGHMLGLRDRYLRKGGKSIPDKGFENDVMGVSVRTPDVSVSDVHVMELFGKAVERFESIQSAANVLSKGFHLRPFKLRHYINRKNRQAKIR